jgi:cytochrome bd-type quinol oxidase subunit 2
MAVQAEPMRVTGVAASQGSLLWSARLIALAGIGLIGYAILFLVVNFTNFIELGLGQAETGATKDTVLAFSPKFYDYVSHLQVALSGFIAGVGIALVVLAMWGIQRRQKWAFWGAAVSAIVAVGVALPLHYPYGLATVGHLGLIYADLLIFVVGFVLGLRAFSSESSGAAGST